MVVVALVVPQIALASWWNPFSWFKRTQSQTITQVQPAKNNTEQATSTTTEIDTLRKEIVELKKQQSTVQTASKKLTQATQNTNQPIPQAEIKSSETQIASSTNQTTDKAVASSVDVESYKKFISSYEKSFRERVNGGLLSNKALQSHNNDSNPLALNYANTAENNLTSAYQIISNIEVPNVIFSDDIKNFVDKYISYVNLYIERVQIVKAMAMLPPKEDYYPADLDKLRQLVSEYEKNIKLVGAVYQELWVLQTKLEESAKNTFGVEIKISREK